MHIQLFSPIRTGSTLVYNYLREIVDPSVMLSKTHSLQPDADFTICTIRNPFNSIVSSCLRYKHQLSNHFLLQNAQEYLDNGGRDVCRLPDSALLLRYEEFTTNSVKCIHMLKQFCAAHNIPHDHLCNAHSLAKKYTVSRVQTLTKAYTEFEQYDTQTHFHGRHISVYHGQTDYRQLLTRPQIRQLYRQVLRVCLVYGY